MRTRFITWYPYCRRSDAIAEALGGTSHLVHYLTFKRPLHAPLKYVLQSVATLRLLRRDRPELILVAVPPIFAALPVWLYARRANVRMVIDAHTGIFEHTRWRWLMPLTRLVMKHADAVIVTNEHLRGRAADAGARAVVIGDVPVRFGPGRPPAACSGPRVVVVNSFSVDEPIEAVLEAAGRIPAARFFVTGDLRHARPAWLQQHPPNLAFTGFLPEEDYVGLLRAADVIVVLTTYDHTMQRGAYEAVALGKPLVTSDWGLLRETFSRGTVHVSSDPDAIAAGIRRALADRDRMGHEMARLRVEREAIFAGRLAELLRVVGAGPVTASAPMAALQ